MRAFLKCIGAIAAFCGTIVIGCLLAVIFFRGEEMPGWLMAIIIISAFVVFFFVVIKFKSRKPNDRRPKEVAAYTIPSYTAVVSDIGDHVQYAYEDYRIADIAGQKKCVRCGKELSDGEQINDCCHDCWCAHLQVLREFYRPYEERLLAFLEKNGIHAGPGTVSGLDETGKPLEAVRKTEPPMFCLGENDRALWLLHVRDAVVALAVFDDPKNVLGLRYVLPSSDSDFMKRISSLGKDDIEMSLYGINRFLAAVSDGTHVYALSDNGKIYHTDPMISGPIPVSARRELHREVWHTFFSDEQIRKSAAWLNDPSGQIVNVDWVAKYYDPAQKMFFQVCTYGDCYLGYDVRYPRLKKEDVIDDLLRDKVLFQTWEKCGRGEIPIEAKFELAEEAPEDMEYVPRPDLDQMIHYA